MVFEVLPAIDVRAGRVVRLRQGDFSHATEYGHDPLAVARDLAAAGARWLHIVDLDGARGEPRQEAILAATMAAASAVQCEVAGGLRTTESVAGMLAIGAQRVVVATAALADPDFASGLVAEFGPDRIVAALDVRDGLAVGEAWRAGAAGRPVLEALDALADAGISLFAVTAIARDGLMAGPDLELLAALVEAGRGGVLAAGGIASIDDLRAVRALGCKGAIIGRALYEGRLSLDAALSVTE